MHVSIIWCYIILFNIILCHSMLLYVINIIFFIFIHVYNKQRYRTTCCNSDHLPMYLGVFSYTLFLLADLPGFWINRIFHFFGWKDLVYPVWQAGTHDRNTKTRNCTELIHPDAASWWASSGPSSSCRMLRLAPSMLGYIRPKPSTSTWNIASSRAGISKWQE